MKLKKEKNMKKNKNSLATSNPEELHQRLLKLSLWDSLNKNRKQPISFAFKVNPHDVINRALSVEYLARMRQRESSC
jgi:hypothetical protein